MSLPFTAKRGRRESDVTSFSPPAKAQRLSTSPQPPSSPSVAPAPPSAGPTSFGRHAVRVEPVIKRLYNVINSRTFLDWGLTSDWAVSGPRSTRAQQPPCASASASSARSAAAALPPAVEKSENSASEGYGEMTEGSIQRLLNHLAELRVRVLETGGEVKQTASFLNASHELRADSSLLDVGSGYGKVVLHAALCGAVARSEGVEFVPSRAERASELLADLRSGELATRMQTDAAVLSRLLSRCALRCGDATSARESLEYSHIYMYDKVFAPATLRALAPKLSASKRLRVLVSYRPLSAWLQLGLKRGQWASVGSICMRTTGGQNFTAFILARLR